MGWLYSGQVTLGTSAAAKTVHEGLRWRGSGVPLWKLTPLSEAPWEEGMSESVLFNLSCVYRYCGLSKCFSFLSSLSLFFLFFSVRQKRSHICKIVATFAGGTVIFSLVDCPSHHEPVLLCHRSICATAACWLEEIPAWTKTYGRRRGAGGWGKGRGEREKRRLNQNQS